MSKFSRELDRTLAQLTVPQGYTLSIGGSLAMAAGGYALAISLFETYARR